jgi:hypothetical protein
MAGEFSLAGGALGLAGAYDPRFGLAGTGLSLLDPEADAKRRAMAAAAGLSQGAQFSGNPTLAGIGGDVGFGLGLAGAGYNIYNTLNNPNLDTAHKGAGIGEGIGEGIASYVTPWGALPAISTALGGQLQKSGSPEVRGTGRFLSTLGRPVDVTKNPFTAHGLKNFGETLALGGPIGMALSNAIGFNPFESKPTTGTLYRDELGQIFGKLGVKGANMGLYNAPTAGYQSYDPKALAASQSLAQFLTPYAHDARKNMPAYTLQTQNLLLNNYGNDLPSLAEKIRAHFNK